MRIGAALTGDLRQIMRQEVTVLSAGITSGTVRTTDNLKDRLRKQVAAAGLGVAVQKAWQSKTYPSGNSMSAAGYVFSKAKRIHAAFDAGGFIRPVNGDWLVIPLPAAKRLGLDTSYKSAHGGKPRHWSNVDAAIRRFGSLRRVVLPGGRVLLIASRVTSSGRRRATRTHRGGGTVQGVGNVDMPLFLLVKRVRLGRRLDIAAAADAAQVELLPQVIRAIAEADNRSR